MRGLSFWKLCVLFDRGPIPPADSFAISKIMFLQLQLAHFGIWPLLKLIQFRTPDKDFGLWEKKKDKWLTTLESIYQIISRINEFLKDLEERSFLTLHDTSCFCNSRQNTKWNMQKLQYFLFDYTSRHKYFPRMKGHINETKNYRKRRYNIIFEVIRTDTNVNQRLHLF